MQHGGSTKQARRINWPGNPKNWTDILLFMAYTQSIEDALDGKVHDLKRRLIDPRDGELPKAINN